MVIEANRVMIASDEFNLSEKQMFSFFRSIPKELESSVGLMGGWAVTYLLENRKIKHVGSRDIDIFYDSASVTYETITELIARQRFEPHSTFRWAKFYDRRTGKQIGEDESKTVEQYNLITIYLDLAAPDAIGDHVMHEPLLRDVFAGKCERWYSQGSQILMPEIGIMVKIKIKTVPKRVDNFKRQKDLVDLVAMLKNVQSLWLIKDGVAVHLREDLREAHAFALKKELSRFSRDGTINVVADALGLNSNVVLEILRRL